MRSTELLGFQHLECVYRVAGPAGCVWGVGGGRFTVGDPVCQHLQDSRKRMDTQTEGGKLHIFSGNQL